MEDACEGFMRAAEKNMADALRMRDEGNREGGAFLMNATLQSVITMAAMEAAFNGLFGKPKSNAKE